MRDILYQNKECNPFQICSPQPSNPKKPFEHLKDLNYYSASNNLLQNDDVYLATSGADLKVDEIEINVHDNNYHSAGYA